jgi:hypothetical protein
MSVPLAARLGLGRGKGVPARLQIGMRAVTLQTAGQPGTSITLDEPSLGAVCEAARSLLERRSDRSVQVHLGCGWSRILLLPWSEQLAREEHWRNLAVARFEELFGDDPAAWEIRVAINVPGRARIAVGWPKALYEALATHQEVTSVRVGLLEHLGVLLVQAPHFSGCVIELDTDGAGFLLLSHGVVQRARWRHYDGAQGLASAVHAEWANVLAALDDQGDTLTALAVTPPALLPGSERAAAIQELVVRLGIREGFSLPD